MKDFQTIRSTKLAGEIAVIDGQPGCGKTLFNTLCSYLDRFEVMQYSPHIENLFALLELEKIEYDACQTMLEIEIDLLIYESMMSRNANFRHKDLSSVFHNKQLPKYLKRLFLKGNEYVPERIKKEKPILHLCTHNLLGYSEPFFKSYPNHLKFLEIVRHPLYQVIQIALNYETMAKTDNARFFYINKKDQLGSIPSWAADWDDYHSMNYVDKAINEMYFMTQLTEKFKKENKTSNLLTVSFEKFVLEPDDDLKLIKSFFDSDFIIPESKVLKMQKVPREKVADGIPIPIYIRCGWEPGEEGLTEEDELKKRREFVINQGASDKSISMLDELSSNYINEYKF